MKYYYNYNEWLHAAQHRGYTVDADGSGKHVAVDKDMVERGVYGLYASVVCGYFYA